MNAGTSPAPRRPDGDDAGALGGLAVEAGAQEGFVGGPAHPDRLLARQRGDRVLQPQQVGEPAGARAAPGGGVQAVREVVDLLRDEAGDVQERRQDVLGGAPGTRTRQHGHVATVPPPTFHQRHLVPGVEAQRQPEAAVVGSVENGMEPVADLVLVQVQPGDLPAVAEIRPRVPPA
ncbi:hypothetical protein ACFSTC_17475 [Nonomuraea ferruginea]